MNPGSVTGQGGASGPYPPDGPQPELPADAAALVERLAELVHEGWMRQRTREGWSCGPVRDDAQRQHPCLVPYRELPDAEKEYDRISARETLRALIGCGYWLQPPPTMPVSADESGFDHLLAATGKSEELSHLIRAWSGRRPDDSRWMESIEPYRHLGRRLLSLGVPSIAREVAAAGLAVERDLAAAVGPPGPLDGGDATLRQILGLALTRTANPEQARRVLGRLRDEGRRDEETLGLLAGNSKRLALQAGDPTVRRQLLMEARRLYEEAWAATGGFWTAINAASLATLTGDRDRARAIAAAVRPRCLAEEQAVRAAGGQPFWILATLGEAALNLGDLEAAGDHYRAACAAAPGNFGDIDSARRQARWILEAMGEDPAVADRWLPPPRVILFAGHMVDRPGRPAARFPGRLAAVVKDAIRHALATEGGLIGFSSAACGGDILFQEVVHELGGQTFVVLPHDAARFVTESVAITAEGDWGGRFEAVLGRAARTIVASPQPCTRGRVSLAYANAVLHGLAVVKARELGTTVGGLAVWDGKPGDGPHGTAEVVDRLHRSGAAVRVIDPRSEVIKARELVGTGPRTPPQATAVASPDDPRVMAMLFGDAVNFSRLSDEQVVLFTRHFLVPIAALLDGPYRDHIAVRNTWGAGLYLVFDDVGAAGRCALDIGEFVGDHVRHDRWPDLGLPADLDIRLAVHAGPVVPCPDPVTGAMNYAGSHVSRAARLEPRTPPGQVYASEAFAALAALENVAEFSCEYVEQLQWAKHYGSFPTYVVRRTAADARP